MRSHCSPKVSSRPPTTSRSALIGSVVSAGPRAAVTPRAPPWPRPTPVSAERQLRVTPTASTIVSASTASTAQARKTESASPAWVPLMRSMLARDVKPGSAGASESRAAPGRPGRWRHRRSRRARPAARRRAGVPAQLALQRRVAPAQVGQRLLLRRPGPVERRLDALEQTVEVGGERLPAPASGLRSRSSWASSRSTWTAWIRRRSAPSIPWLCSASIRRARGSESDSATVASALVRASRARLASGRMSCSRARRPATMLASTPRA